MPAPPEQRGHAATYRTEPDASCDAVGTCSVIGCPLEAAVDLIEARLELAPAICELGSWPPLIGLASPRIFAATIVIGANSLLNTRLLFELFFGMLV